MPSLEKETDPLIPRKELVDKEQNVSAEGVFAEFEPNDEENRMIVEKEEESSFTARLCEVMRTSFLLGLTTFGDSSLSIALVQVEVVEKGEWVGYETFMELYGLTQAIPGPVATQVFMSAAMVHAGPLGALISLVCWALPGATLMTVIGVLVRTYVRKDRINIWLSGVPPATLALVLQASIKFSQHLDPFSFGLALSSCLCSVLIDGDERIADQITEYVYPLMLITGGLMAILDAMLLGIGHYEIPSEGVHVKKITSRIHMTIWGGLMILQIWFLILLVAIVLSNHVYQDDPAVYLFSRFYRMGSVVFSGDESVLPMITSEMVPDWLTQQAFSHGLAFAQAVPGSVFNLAAYIGAIESGSIGTALVAVTSIYVPSYLFLLAFIPIWGKLRRVLAFRALLKGVNAVSIGFMGAMCIFLWEGSIRRASDAMILILCIGLTSFYQVQAPIVILLAIAMGLLLNEAGLRVAQKPYNTDYNKTLL